MAQHGRGPEHSRANGSLFEPIPTAPACSAPPLVTACFRPTASPFACAQRPPEQKSPSPCSSLSTSHASTPAHSTATIILCPDPARPAAQTRTHLPSCLPSPLLMHAYMYPNPLPSGGPFLGRSSPPSDGGGPASYPEVAHSFEPRPTPPLPRCPSNLHCTNAIPCIAHVHVLTLTAQLRQDAEEVVVQVSPSSFRLSISPRCQLSEGMRVLGGFCEGQVARSRAGELSCACLCASMHV